MIQVKKFEEIIGPSAGGRGQFRMLNIGLEFLKHDIDIEYSENLKDGEVGFVLQNNSTDKSETKASCLFVMFSTQFKK